MAKKKHILVVEDDAILNELIRETLEGHGARVTMAKNGEKAIELLASGMDLLLLDLLMPGTDGFAVLEHAHREFPKIPAVILTNLSDKKSRDRCRTLGCKIYLVKSDLDDDDVWEAVSKQLV